VENAWRLPQDSLFGLSCALNIQLDPAGNVIDVRLTQSSGDRNFDNSAIAAVYRASPLPLPIDPDAAALFRNFNFKFNPGG
jgi:colicin import membrane protein